MKKNVASQSIGVQMIDASDGTAFTGTTTVYVTGDAGTQAIGGTASGVCTHEGNGYHSYVPTQAETNYNLIAFTFIGTGAIPVTIQVETSFPQTVDNNTILAGLNDVSTAEVNAQCDLAISDAALATAASVSALNDISEAEVNAQVDTALSDYDPPTNAEMIAAFTEIKGATWSSSTDTLEDIIDTGNAGWITGGSSPTVTEIRQEMDSNSTQLATLVARLIGTIATGTHYPATAAQIAVLSDWINGGRLDLLLDAIPTTAMRGTDSAATATEVAKIPKSDGTATWNATALASINSEADTALTDYDPPTRAEATSDKEEILAVVDDLGIKKNTTFSNYEFLMVLTSDHVTPATGLTVTGQRSIDGGAFASVTGSIAEVSNGIYQFDAVAADTNGDLITWRFSSATADDCFFTFKTVV